jgi:hypothetical protein
MLGNTGIMESFSHSHYEHYASTSASCGSAKLHYLNIDQVLHVVLDSLRSPSRYLPYNSR